MTTLKINTTKLKQIIKDIAAQEIIPGFNKIGHTFKKDGSIVTAVDIAVQQRVTSALKQHWPDFVLLGEEMTEEEQTFLLNADKPVWCLDPLDGTSNFAAGVPYFAVSLALIYHNTVVLGLVYDPMRDECFLADNTQEDSRVIGYLNDEKLSPIAAGVTLKKSIAIVDFKRLTNNLATRIVTERPFASQRNFGASALDWCWLAAGRGHVYLHGNQNIWDYAAGEFVFRAMGGFSQTLDGETVFKKAIEKRSVVAAINKPLFDEWVQWINSDTF